MKKSLYALSSLFYFLAFLSGVLFLGWSLKNKNIYLGIIAVLIIYISLDNFFCSSRIKKYGYKAKGHYSFPGFRK